MQTPEIIAAALQRLTDEYIFPDKAALAAGAVTAALSAGDFDALDGPALCTRVTEIFFEQCADKHLRLMWSEEPQDLDKEEDDDGEAMFAAMMLAANYGVRRVERLEGNVGYLDLTLVSDAAAGARVIAAAMELVANTEALIIDLRANRGGAPNGVQLWCSYLFPDDGTHLNDVYSRVDDTTRQYWTLAHVDGSRYLDRPVYVLTSGTTFSGGEELAYNLKTQKRATLVGETTRGGAHPTDFHPLTPHVVVAVPNARAINPVTGTNWEGVGVEPDVAVSADEAFDVAYRDARDRVAGG
ncbi:S41 family peptidase [Catenulispora sp. NL8]|uniref:S41 family peptidase n=1 Tax=Catenulispora pinistramenti TaxID=2705254 RepID=A0ABS5KV43_9ACTN|nr:S41 family peptidase [Catenulispora pinistramenti]MBS2549923.1 S41 family peptidase [Catenulispora pinistramenti]